MVIIAPDFLPLIFFFFFLELDYVFFSSQKIENHQNKQVWGKGKQWSKGKGKKSVVNGTVIKEFSLVKASISGWVYSFKVYIFFAGVQFRCSWVILGKHPFLSCCATSSFLWVVGFVEHNFIVTVDTLEQDVTASSGFKLLVEISHLIKSALLWA